MRANKSLQTNTINIQKFSFFYNLFIYISLLVIIIIIISSIGVNRLHSKQLNTTIGDFNEKMLSSTSYNFEFMHQSVESLLLRLSTDVKVNQLIYTEVIPESLLDVHRLMEVMTSFKQNAEFIQSFYLYNDRTETFFTIGSANTIRSKEEMFDKDIIDIINKSLEDAPTINVYPRTVVASPYNTTIEVEVYTYVLTVKNYSDGSLEKAYVVNVMADWFLDSIEIMTDKNMSNNSSLVVYKTDGTIMAFSGNDDIARRLEDEVYFNAVMEENVDKGSISFKSEGQTYMVSFNKLELDGIVIVSIVEEDQLYSEIRVMNLVTLFLMVVLLFFGVITAFILSKVFYKPISNLKSNLQLLFDGSEEDNQGNEFQLMQSLFEDVHSNLLRLKSFKTSNMASLKEQMLVNILKKKIIHLDEVEEKCLDLELAVDVKQRMQLLFFDIDYYKVFEQKENLHAETEDLKALILQLMSKYNGTEVLNFKHYFAVLVNVSVGKTFSQEDLESIEVLRKIQEEIKAKTDVTLTITVSPTVRTIGDLYEMYLKLRQLHQVRLTKGRGSIIFNDVEEEITDDFQLPVESTKMMLSYLMGQETEKCQEKCHEIITELHNHEINNVRLAISFMSISIIDTINTIKSNARLSLNLDFNEWHDYVFSLEILTDIDDFFCETMANVVGQMKENKKNRSSELVSQIRDFIGEHYSEYSMTPNSIAKAQGLTLKYANTLFKKDTGSSIGSFINDYRLDHAAELLITTNYSLDNILDQIGWENQSYFFTVFKKRFGVTPSIYRSNQ